MKTKKPLIIIGAIVAVVLLLILCLPLFINANQFKPTLETKLTAALGRKVTIGDIKLAIFSGGVTVSDISIADDCDTIQITFGILDQWDDEHTANLNLTLDRRPTRAKEPKKSRRKPLFPPGEDVAPTLSAAPPRPAAESREKDGKAMRRSLEEMVSVCSKSE
jgi:hypothetical protein